MNDVYEEKTHFNMMCNLFTIISFTDMSHLMVAIIV